MFWPDTWTHQQHLDPLAGWIAWSPLWSTLLAALPVIVLFWLLVLRRWLAPKAGAAAALVAILIAIFVYSMRPDMAVMSFFHGAAFGLLPVGWTIFNAMLLYNVTVQTGKFDIVRRSVASLSGDARIQAILIAFSFGAFLEGAAGGGTPVAICGAIMVGLGFKPFLAAVLCLIANTSPVAYGGLGTPIFTLGVVTGIPNEAISIMAGRQLPFLSFLVPLYMVRCMCNWKQTWEVWPVLLVAGGSFAGFQFLFAHSSMYPMTDIGGGIFSLILTAFFLRFWKPKTDWHFDKLSDEPTPAEKKVLDPSDPHAAEAAAAPGSTSSAGGTRTAHIRGRRARLGPVRDYVGLFTVVRHLAARRGAPQQRQGGGRRLGADSYQLHRAGSPTSGCEARPALA